MRVLGIVPARKGSKSIVGKNMVPLCGKPLIAYTFEAAKESSVNRIVCTTDCQQVGALAEQYGIEVVVRPQELAQDETPPIPVIQHALSMAGEGFDAVCYLQPTCPLRRGQDIDQAIQIMQQEDASAVISQFPVGANHPARMSILINGRVPYPAWGRGLRWARKQDLPPVYQRTGDIYLTRTDVILEGSLVGENERIQVIPRERVCNIDEPFDLLWAEFLLSREQVEAVA